MTTNKTKSRKSHKPRKPSLRGKGTKQNMEPSRRWRDQTPMTKKSRKQMPKHCLLDPVHLRYPVCVTGSSRISCIGLEAAEKRARMQRDTFIQQKAKALRDAYC